MFVKLFMLCVGFSMRGEGVCESRIMIKKDKVEYKPYLQPSFIKYIPDLSNKQY